MSSIRTRTAQRIKESFNAGLITRDTELDGLLDDCQQVELALKRTGDCVDRLKGALESISTYCADLSQALEDLYGKSAFHQGLAIQIAEAHQAIRSWTAESVDELSHACEEKRMWSGLFDEVRNLQKQREKTRLVYDHYLSKVEDLQTALAKKKSKNPAYQETSKEQDRLARNQRKLGLATENFRSDSQKCVAKAFQALENRYELTTPLVGKLVLLELELTRRASGALAGLRGIPDDLAKANKEREREAAEEQSKIQRRSEVSVRPSDAGEGFLSVPAQYDTAFQGQPARQSDWEKPDFGRDAWEEDWGPGAKKSPEQLRSADPWAQSDPWAQDSEQVDKDPWQEDKDDFASGVGLTRK